MNGVGPRARPFGFSRGRPCVQAPPVPSPAFFVQNRGLSVAVHRLGSAEGAPVLALHGFLDHGRAFARAADAASDVTVYAPDARGHGASGWVGSGGYYHFYDYLDDLQRVLARLPPDLGLVGHSMGGTLALALAALNPGRFRWLLLLEGMGPPSHAPDDTPERLRAWLRALVPDRVGDVDVRSRHRTRMDSAEEAADRLVRLNPRLAPDHARELASSFTEPHPLGGVTWRFDPMHRTPSAKPFRLDEVFPLWRRIEIPVTSVWGERGFHPDRLAERHACLTDLEVGVIDGAGHNLHHERPEVVGELITRLAAGTPGFPATVHPARADLSRR